MGPRVSHIKYRNLYAGSAKCNAGGKHILIIEKSCQSVGSLPLANNYGVCNLGFMLLFLSAVTMSDIHELQQQIKQLVELIQKLASDFRAVKAELEESRVDVDSIHKTFKGIIN